MMLVKSRTILLIAILLSTNVNALKKCELPLLYLDIAVNELVRKNLDNAKYNFSVYFDLHKKLESECATRGYTDSMNILLDQYAAHRKYQ